MTRSLALVCLCLAVVADASLPLTVSYLTPSKSLSEAMVAGDRHIVCFMGKPSIIYQPWKLIMDTTMLTALWSDAKLHISGSKLRFNVATGNKTLPEESAKLAMEQRNFNFAKQSRPLSIPVRPVNVSCFGIEALTDGILNVRANSAFSPSRAALWASGLGLVFASPMLGQSALFYYASFGTLGSLVVMLIVIYFVYSFVRRRIPLPTALVDVIMGFNVFGIACFASLSEAVQEVFDRPTLETMLALTKHRYFQLAVVAFCVVFFLSVSYAYVKGPPSKRMANVLSIVIAALGMAMSVVAMQDKLLAFVVALSCLVFSFPSILAPFGWAAKTAFAIITLPFRVVYFIAWVVTWPLFAIWRRCFGGPRGRKFMTAAEYERESEEYTRAQLEELREYVDKSPEKLSMIRRLSNKAQVAMIKFATGEDHIPVEERSSYELMSEDDQSDYEDDGRQWRSESSTRYTGYSSSPSPARRHQSRGRSRTRRRSPSPEYRSHYNGRFQQTAGGRRVYQEHWEEDDDDEFEGMEAPMPVLPRRRANAQRREAALTAADVQRMNKNEVRAALLDRNQIVGPITDQTLFLFKNKLKALINSGH